MTKPIKLKNSLKFRAALAVDSEYAIIVPVNTITAESYTIDLNAAHRIFDNKYPEASFWDFIECVSKQEYIREVSDDCDLIITKDFTNLMQSTGIYDATKWKELSPEKKSEWLKENKLQDWKGVEIFEGDVTEIKYSKDHYSYGVVSYFENSAGYDRGGTSLGSYQKRTKVVGNIYEGWPACANYDVDFFFDTTEENE